jgi:hypothetical protein
MAHENKIHKLSENSKNIGKSWLGKNQGFSHRKGKNLGFTLLHGKNQGFSHRNCKNQGFTPAPRKSYPREAPGESIQTRRQ